jgi:hypothetical protein
LHTGRISSPHSGIPLAWRCPSDPAPPRTGPSLDSMGQSPRACEAPRHQAGKVVQGHFRTAPDHTRLNNWSTKGNVNPMTGEVRDQVPSAWTQVEGTEVQALEGTPCQEGGTMIRLLWLLALLEALALLSVKPSDMPKHQALCPSNQSLMGCPLGLGI